MAHTSWEYWVLPAGSVLPAASITYRGVLAFLLGNAGTSDKIYACLKGSDDVYYWRKIWDGDADIIVNSITGL
jgi:hypothetical protein